MKLLLATALLCACVGLGSAYFCWECDSDEAYAEGSTCSDPFYWDDSALAKRMCSGACFKEITTHSDGRQSYRRGCDACVEECTTIGASRTCRSCCRGDLCNSAPSWSVNKLVLLVSSIGAAVFCLL
ncbi:uncharacterized protein [Diadema antillarum]|uniref:uncharacterized protein n=1 Tax=Diadema antillarum TaxID=105358 RepID=UPI003A842D59